MSENEILHDEFSWAAHPAADRVGHAALAGLAVLAMSVMTALAFGHVIWGVLALFVLLAALNRFYFPSRFIIDEQGITAKYPLRKKHERWDELRRFVHDKHGGYLSTRAQPSRLDAYRGIHILFGDDREDVIRRINAHMNGTQA